MSTDTSTVTQLAHSRLAIAQYWAQENRQASTSGTTAKSVAAPAIPHVLAGLALIAVAEQLLRQSTPLRSHRQNFPILETTRTLLHATAQTRPGWLVTTAALVGAGLAAARPWRWLKCSDLLPHLLTQLTAQALASVNTRKK